MKMTSKTKASSHSSKSLVPNCDFLTNESYKAIRTNILHLLKDFESKIILITSPYASAGKTTSTANLAITFSQLGQKVLVVDADMRKSALHRLFSMSSTPGLSNVLTGTNHTEVIKKTPYDNLYLLPAGAVPQNPSELLHSERFSELLKTLSSEYDCIFIDTPPVDAVTDAVIISQQTTGTLLVIRQNSTEKDALIRTVNTLNNVKANILGYILNAVDYDKFSYRYGHYYGRYGGKYSSKYYSYSTDNTERNTHEEE